MGMRTDFIPWVIDNIPHQKTIIELGAGKTSTKIFNEFYNLYSIEHNEQYINLYKGVNYIHAPLKNEWYDPDIIKQMLPDDYDCIVVDGPPGMLNNNNQIRYGFIKNLSLFKDNVPIIFDDTDRVGWGEEKAVSKLKEIGFHITKYDTFTVCRR